MQTSSSVTLLGQLSKLRKEELSLFTIFSGKWFQAQSRIRPAHKGGIQHHTSSSDTNTQVFFYGPCTLTRKFVSTEVEVLRVPEAS